MIFTTAMSPPRLVLVPLGRVAPDVAVHLLRGDALLEGRSLPGAYRRDRLRGGGGIGEELLQRRDDRGGLVLGGGRRDQLDPRPGRVSFAVAAHRRHCMN